MESRAEELTQIEKLEDSETFQVWNFQINILFKASGLYEVVNGKKQLKDLKTDEEREEWSKKDAKAQKIIITTINRKVLMHILNCESSAEMYGKLCSVYQRDNEQQKCTLLQEFFNFKYDKSSDISLQISKLENISYRLKAINQKIDDEMIISKILSILPDTYRHFRTAWESTVQTERTLTNLTSRLITEEASYKNNESEKSLVFSTTEKKYKTSKTSVKCYSCGKGGHIARNCVGMKEASCNICKKNNHKEKDCYFRRKHGETKAEQVRKVAFLTENTAEIQSDDMFVMDSGATSHMVNNIGLFNSIKELDSEINVAKKDTIIKAKGKGIVETDKCIFENVLYVPELSKNLISVNAITEKNGKVIFQNDKVYVEKNGHKVLEGKKNENGLYIVNPKTKEESMFTVNIKEKVAKWHRKLGHLGIESMKKLIENEMVSGLDISKRDCDSFEIPCKICLEAKQTRFPFNNQRARATRPFQIIHVDIAGPIDPPTWDGKKYTLTVLDDFTHYTVIYLLEKKNEVKDYLKEYVAEMEAFTNARLSKMRSDNGGEFINNDLKIWCKRKGIVMDVTVPHSPQLNGKAERLNRTLFDKARSLIFDSELPKELWGEAIRVAVYILNRSPTQSCLKTPSEMWTNRKPDLSKMQIFGSEAYAKVLGHLKKLDKRSKKYIFVGYALNGYRLWDKEKQKIEIHRDVVFQPIKQETESVAIKMSIEEEIEETDYEDIQEVRREKREDQQLSKAEINMENEEVSLEDDDIEGHQTRYNLRHNRTQPRRLNDYELQCHTSLLTIYDEEEPQSYEEAMDSKECLKWTEAIKSEVSALKENDTWIRVEDQSARNIVETKWVFKRKKNESGKIVSYKARLVARGFQQKGVASDIYSPVAKLPSVRVFLALCSHLRIPIFQLDVCSAFLNGNIKGEVYISLPKGFIEEPGTICKLKKSLYGLKCSPKDWNEKFNEFMLSLNFIRSEYEYCIYVKTTETYKLYILLYVDDVLLAGTDNQEVCNLKHLLSKAFKIKDLGQIKHFLGMVISQDLSKGSVSINQTNYLKNVLIKADMQNCKSATTPMDANFKHDYLKREKSESYEIENRCRTLIGSLMYAMMCSRPDLCISISILSRYQSCASHDLLKEIKRILRYVKGTLNYSLVFKLPIKISNVVEGYSDSDWAGDRVDRKSTSGYIFKVFDCTISWASRKQATVALSSTEAEYVALSLAVSEACWLRYLMKDLQFENEYMCVKLFADNQSAIKVCKNPEFHKRLKHVDIKFHFIRDKVKENIIDIEYLSTDKQIADMFTKPLGRTILNKFCGSIGLE